MKINGETKLIGFFGSTFKTSKMYAMYNAVFENLGLNYVYVPLVVNDIKKGVKAIKALGIHAVGVTIPFKISMIEYLDELDEDARRIGAVNVVVNKNGKLIGSNTDGHGGVRALKEKTEVKEKKVILLGAGGAARALAFAIKDEGGRLTILNRTVSDAEELAKSVGCRFDGLEKLAVIVEDTDILINGTSVGMAPEIDQSLVDKIFLQKKLTVMDIVSNPRETKLLKEAKEAGCQTVFADRMLLWQGVLKFKLYTGVEPAVKVMEKALQITSH
ncbi:MAG: shikimate dehydrogenase [Patescibacteria group bacterium]